MPQMYPGAIFHDMTILKECYDIYQFIAYMRHLFLALWFFQNPSGMLCVECCMYQQ